MTDAQFCALILLATITAACAIYLAAEHAWDRYRQWRWDRHVAATVALAAEQPEAVAVMGDDWPLWSAERREVR